MGELQTTAARLSSPRRIELWFGVRILNTKADDGRVLRVENSERRAEAKFLRGLVGAIWTHVQIATLGSSLPHCSARHLSSSPRAQHARTAAHSRGSRAACSILPLIHTLVFGLLIVSSTADPWRASSHRAADALCGGHWTPPIRATPCASISLRRVARVVPNFVSNHLYVWGTTCAIQRCWGLWCRWPGFIGIEAVSLFRWGRLATLLITIVLMVVAFDAVSRRIRAALL